ncbi:hypothetical protein PG987_008546 [Apiospora arundinis]|uniref:Zinc-binding domain-containing protein n=1 Tax=Apiospora arundinis TaxID=335852 RepID=A0ABR2I2J1_9PEZI
METNGNPDPKSGVETRTSFMFPWLHKRVADAVHDQVGRVYYHEQGRDSDARERFDTYVMGKFLCKNQSCESDAWTSKKVSITIRRFVDGSPGIGYNATVYNQACAACLTLGTFSIHQDTYVERVAYRLRKWAGVPQEKQYFDADDRPPHMADLCEGCKRGHCKQGWELSYHNTTIPRHQNTEVPSGWFHIN